MKVSTAFLVSLAFCMSGSRISAVAASPAVFAPIVQEGPAEVAGRLARAGKKWARTSNPNKPGAVKAAMFTIYPVQFVPASSEQKPPLATVMCGNNKMFALVDGGPLKDGNIKFTFDNGSVLTQTWAAQGNRWFPAPADNAAILKSWATAKSFKFEYTPADHARQTATFDMADYQESVLKEPLCKQ